jgi:NTP pyrophosphatase (non-canonical NTP hydrolase)
LKKNIELLIDSERIAQDQKWREQNHNDLRWLAILMEEVGELSKEILEGKSSLKAANELVQVAAVTIAWLEAIERRR